MNPPHRKSRTFILIVALAMSTVACQPRSAVLDTAGQEIAVVAEAPASNQVAAVTPPPPTPTPTPLPPRPSGVFRGSARLLAPETFQTTDPNVRRDGFSSHGFTLTPDQYAAGYRRFLAGRTPSQALENQYRLHLEEQLLALAWLNHPNHAPRAGQAPHDPSGEMQLLESAANATLERWPDGRPIAEDDIRALYDLRIERFRRPERTQVRIIQVPTIEEANLLLGRIEEGESFGQLAATESRHASRTRFGELEPFARGSYSADFEEVAFTLEPGETRALETTTGVFIIQRIAAIPSVVTPYEEVRSELLRELRAQLREAKANEIRSKLKGP